MTKAKTFTFEFDPSSDVPLWVQIRQRILYLITSGYFEAGDLLPSVRNLASDFSINYNTANKAYLSLISDGYLTSVRGSGVYVNGTDAEVLDENNKEIAALLDDFIAAERELGLSLTDIQFMVSRRILQLKREESGEGEEASGGRVIPLDEKVRRSGSGA